MPSLPNNLHDALHFFSAAMRRKASIKASFSEAPDSNGSVPKGDGDAENKPAAAGPESKPEGNGGAPVKKENKFVSVLLPSETLIHLRD